MGSSSRTALVTVKLLYSLWSMFSLGGVACGPESGGTCEAMRRCMPVKFLAASLIGAAGRDGALGAVGCDGPLDGGDGGVVGGGTVPPPPWEPAETRIADEEPVPAEVEPAAPAPPAAPDNSTPA